MYGANHCPSLFGEIDQQGDALLYRHNVQPTIYDAEEQETQFIIMSY